MTPRSVRGPVQRRISTSLCGLSVSVLLAACGGGGGGADAGSDPAVLTGVAATGAPLAEGQVQVLDRSGASVCTNAPVTTDASGTYSCQLSATSQAPMAIVVRDPQGLVSPLVSLVASKPAAGAAATVHATPLTTAIAQQLDTPARTGLPRSAMAWVQSPAALANLDLAALSAVKANLVAQLADVLATLGLDASTFDPTSGPLVAGSRTGADALLEQVRVTFRSDGVPLLGNVLNSGTAAVAMAGVSAGSFSTVPVSIWTSDPGGATSFSLVELDHFRTALQACFAVPSGQRAPGPDTVNRRLLSVAEACRTFIAGLEDSAVVDMDFLQNGYAAEVFFYSLLTDPDMDGGAVHAPELLRLTQSPDGRHRALINLRVVDHNGVAGNRILVAQKFPGSRPEGQSQWWLVGNQRAVDVVLRAAVVQREQMIPANLLDASSFFDEALRSRVEVGLQISVRRPNNGGTVSDPNNPNNAVRYVRVKGPGLPIAGVVMADVAPTDGRSDMSYLNATGTIPTSVDRAENSGNIFRLQRTRGLADSATPRSNPGVDEASPAAVNWAHPSMYGQSPATDWQVDLSTVVAGSAYTFEVFCASTSTPCHSFQSLLLTSLPSAMTAAQLPWAQWTDGTRAQLGGDAPASSTVNLAWTAPVGLERVTSAYVQGYTPTLFVDGYASVTAGSTSRSVTANGAGTYPALSFSDNQVHRAARLQYYMFDGSYKEQWAHFN